VDSTITTLTDPSFARNQGACTVFLSETAVKYLVNKFRRLPYRNHKGLYSHFLRDVSDNRRTQSDQM